MAVSVRASRADDGPTLQAIEALAGERFREVGLASVAEHAPFPISTLTEYAEAGRSWVVVDEHDVPIGYALVDVVDGQAHLEQISVRPDEQGRGVGRALIERVRYWAQGSRCSAMTLTTFDTVPWNRPYYEWLGFRVLQDAEIGPELRALQMTETAHGLDPAIRVAMRLDLGSYVPRAPEEDRALADPSERPAGSAPRIEPLAIGALAAGFIPLVAVVAGLWGLFALVPVVALQPVVVRRVRSSSGRSRGTGLARAGLLLGLAAIVVGLAGYNHWYGNPPEPGGFALRAGDCFDDDATTSDLAAKLRAVPCSGPHLAETISNDPASLLLGDSYPGPDDLEHSAKLSCARAFEDYVGLDPGQSEYRSIALTPTVTAWNRHARQILCAAGSKDHSPLPGGSVRGVGR